MKRLRLVSATWGLVAGILFLAACAAPASAPAATSAPASSGAAAGTTGADAWQKIVAAAKQEGGLLVYTQSYSGTDTVAIGKEFEAKTGIHADFISAAGDVLLQRYLTETKGGQSTGDVIEGSPQFLTAGRQQGIFVPLKGQPLPVLSEPASVWDVPPTFMGQDLDVLANREGKTDGHITVNTSLLKPDDYPTSYHDLATNPKFKDKIGFNDPKVTGNVVAMFVKQGYLTNSVTLHDIWSLYNVQQVATFARPGDQETAASRGEVAVAIGTGNYRLYDAVKAGAPIKILSFPDVPVGGFPQLIGVTKAASHPNSAMVFVNWLFSKDGQTFVKQLQGTDDGPRRDVPSFVPNALKAEVVGGGKRGPVVVAAPTQTLLGSDLYVSGIFQKLTEGISADDFEAQANAFIQDWETKHGGPQSGAQGGALTINQ